MIRTRLTDVAVTLAVTDAPDLPHYSGTDMVPTTIDVAYSAKGTTVTVDGVGRRRDGSVGTARRWVRYEPQHTATYPAWVAAIVAAHQPALEPEADRG